MNNGASLRGGQWADEAISNTTGIATPPPAARNDECNFKIGQG